MKHFFIGLLTVLASSAALADSNVQISPFAFDKYRIFTSTMGTGFYLHSEQHLNHTRYLFTEGNSSRLEIMVYDRGINVRVDKNTRIRSGIKIKAKLYWGGGRINEVNIFNHSVKQTYFKPAQVTKVIEALKVNAGINGPTGQTMFKSSARTVDLHLTL